MTERELFNSPEEQPESRLKGDLIDKMRERKENEEYLKNLVLIQRDGGKEWTVKVVNYEKDKITLTDGSATLTKKISTLKEDLTKEGGSWSVKN